MEISGKVFFITGAAHGLGRGMAEEALKKGGKVFMADMNVSTGEETLAEFQKKYGAENVKFGRCDVCSKSQFSAIFQSAITCFGRIDVMVNNAGIMNDKTWEQQIAINYNGVILGTNLALGHMRKDKGGKGGVIINSSSLAGVIPAYWFPIYAGTKSAVVGFTRSWATNPSISSMGVRLACLCPAAADTTLLNLKEDECIDLPAFEAYVNSTGRVPVSAVCDAFIKLVHDEDNNGKLITVAPGKEPFYIKQLLDPPIETSTKAGDTK